MAPQYPLIGPHVQSIFEYIRFEQEDIHLGEFTFDFLDFFGLPPGFNYDIDFLERPIDETTPPTIYSPTSYGIVSTCDAVCALDTIEVAFTFRIGNLIAGPAIRVVSADKDNATLYAALYNPRDNILVFLRYVNQSLITYGTKLGVIFGIHLVDGDVIKLSAIGSNYRVFLNNILRIGSITDAVIDNTNQCVGAIQIQFESAPILKHIEDILNVLYSARTFYYCDDGISVSKPLLPINDSDNHFVSDASLILKSGQEGDKCYGFTYAQGYTNVDFALTAGRGYYIEFQFRYYFTASGSPISGLALLIDESKSDPDDFTGWVLLINKKLGNMQLAYYLNESLNDLPDPSHIVATLAKNISNNTLVRIVGSFADDVDSSLWSIVASTKQPLEIVFTEDINYVGANQLSVGSQATERKTRSNYGLAWVGNDTNGTHAAYWSGSISQQYAIIN